MVNSPLRTVYSEGLLALNFSSDANTLFSVIHIPRPRHGSSSNWRPIRSIPIPFTLHPRREPPPILLAAKKLSVMYTQGAFFRPIQTCAVHGFPRPSRLRLRRDVDICNKSELRVSIHRGTTLTEPEHRTTFFNVLCQVAPTCTGFPKVASSLVFFCLRCQNPR